MRDRVVLDDRGADHGVDPPDPVDPQAVVTGEVPPHEAITRRQAAQRCSVTYHAVVQWQKKGWIKPCAVVAGVHYFTPGDVDEVQRRRGRPIKGSAGEGDLAARLFEAFDAGQDLPTIVRELRVAPRVVREHYAEYVTGLADGERRRRQRERAEREEREAREAARINRSYDREAERSTKEMAKEMERLTREAADTSSLTGLTSRGGTP